MTRVRFTAEPILLAFLAVCLLVLGMPAERASAAGNDVALVTTVDKASVLPGGSVTITMTFTNVQSTEVDFVYIGLVEMYNSILSNVLFGETACSGNMIRCPGDTTFYLTPVAPGDTRTQTETFQVLPGSGCGESVSMSVAFYLYYEFSGGPWYGVTSGFSTAIPCPPPAAGTRL